jgi:hypothetical protein
MLNGNDIISNAFAQVLGIFVVNCLGEDKMHIFFVVTVLESKEKMRGDKYLPYELLGYQKICNLKLSNQKYSFAQEYQFHVMICQRVFMRKEKKKETRAESTLEISDFFGISYKTIDRFGYDEEQCDQKI